MSAEILDRALRDRSQEELASLLNVNPRTVRRWVLGESKPTYATLRALELELGRDERPAQPEFTFVDLFAGIGGLRKGFQELRGKCVFTSEWDSFARRTYAANFPDGEELAGDITQIVPEFIPAHDVLLAGFPCQPFSLAGVSKKQSLGREHGFRDKTQGTLFFNVLEILRAKQPAAFLLENVKNLRSHDGGRTYAIITGALTELGYHLEHKVIDARAWVPQHRERIFLIGFKKNVQFSFGELARPDLAPCLKSILHTSDEEPEGDFTVRDQGKTIVNPKYTLSSHLWNYLQAYAEKHRLLGNGFGYSVFTEDDVARTLSARYHKDGSEILIGQPGKNPRRLTPRECSRLMGFDEPGRSDFKISVSDTQAYRQFGNSVVVPLVRELAKLIVPRMLHPDEFPPLETSQFELMPTGTDG